VVSDDPGWKREDAEALDVEIIDDEAFCKRLEDSLNNHRGDKRRGGFHVGSASAVASLRHGKTSLLPGFDAPFQGLGVAIPLVLPLGRPTGGRVFLRSGTVEDQLLIPVDRR